MIIGGPADDETCLATFHCDDNAIHVMSLDRIAETLEPDNPFAILPTTDFFDSLVIHEIAHAMLFHARGGQGRTFVEDEYVAYAMQMSTLSPEMRESLLDSLPSAGPIGLTDLTEKALMFTPTAFALNAWRHFEEPNHGCDFVDRILDDNVNFGN